MDKSPTMSAEACTVSVAVAFPADPDSADDPSVTPAKDHVTVPVGVAELPLKTVAVSTALPVREIVAALEVTVRVMAGFPVPVACQPVTKLNASSEPRPEAR